MLWIFLLTLEKIGKASIIFNFFSCWRPPKFINVFFSYGYRTSTMIALQTFIIKLLSCRSYFLNNGPQKFPSYNTIFAYNLSTRLLKHYNWFWVSKVDSCCFSSISFDKEDFSTSYLRKMETCPCSKKKFLRFFWSKIESILPCITFSFAGEI